MFGSSGHHGDHSPTGSVQVQQVGRPVAVPPVVSGWRSTPRCVTRVVRVLVPVLPEATQAAEHFILLAMQCKFPHRGINKRFY